MRHRELLKVMSEMRRNRRDQERHRELRWGHSRAYLRVRIVTEQGEINETPCPDCGGSGKTRDNVTISVNIPAGVDNDSVIPDQGSG